MGARPSLDLRYMSLSQPDWTAPLNHPLIESTTRPDLQYRVIFPQSPPNTANMEKTKKVVGEFMNQAGRHDTTVHESTAPAVEHKTIKPTQHEQINTAINQEVHQDHYHRTVQPVQATEVMPEQHTSKVAGTINREFDHRDNEGTERAMRAEAGKLRNERHVESTTHTQSRAPVVQGEHVHQ